jgi:DNA processing protein
MNNVSYLLALHSIDGLGPIRLKAILEKFEDPRHAWEANNNDLENLGIPQNVVNLLVEKRQGFDPEKYTQSIKDANIKWMTIYDDDYPQHLKQIYDPPVVFYYRGEIKKEDENAIGVVGTRKITGYGRVVTHKFVQDLVNAGLTIISGLARGVDAVAHQSALEAKGRTIAVLGGGLKNIYPPENKDLAKKITEGFGAVISEFPPDYPSLPGNFPSRNRIIAGLSKAVLVTEAASDSGSLITARLAVEQGKEVFAVPGPVTSNLSKGPINLIQEGANAVFDAEEIVEEIGIRQELRIEDKELKEITPDEKKIIECIENESMHIDEICRKLGLSASAVSANLLKMEITGLVQNLGGGNYCRS